MSKFFSFVAFIILFSGNSFAGVTTGYKLGKGTLKITTDTANNLEYFLVVAQKEFMQKNKIIHGNQGL